MEIKNETRLPLAALPQTGPEGNPVLSLIVKATFTIVPGGPAAPADEQLPIAFADEFHDDKNPGSAKFEHDIAPFKPKADIALVGRAHAPDGKRVTILDVGLRVGSVSKKVRVFGDRTWSCGGRMLPATKSEPAPFTDLELTYERAYGGIDEISGGFFAHNPVGRGYFVKKRRKALDGAPLPNLEDPAQLIGSWDDRPKPAGFGFWGKGWQPRLAYLGTFDETWLKERSPEPPEDFRWDYHNAAHPDLQVAGYLRGDEEVELAYVTPAGKVAFQLSGLAPACRVTRTGGDGRSGEPVTLNLDTLCFLPDEMRFYQVWRGLCPVEDHRLLDVGEVRVSIG